MKKRGQKSCLLLHPDPDLDPDQMRLRRPLLPVPLCLSLPTPRHPTPPLFLCTRLSPIQGAFRQPCKLKGLVFSQ